MTWILKLHDLFWIKYGTYYGITSKTNINKVSWMVHIHILVRSCLVKPCIVTRNGFFLFLVTMVKHSFNSFGIAITFIVWLLQKLIVVFFYDWFTLSNILVFEITTNPWEILFFHFPTFCQYNLFNFYQSVSHCLL